MNEVGKIRQNEPRVGTRKLQDKLRKEGIIVGRDSLFSLLRGADKLVKPKRKFRKTTYSKHSYAVAPNVLKTREITGPRQAVVSDITYLELKGGKFAYLYLVTDLGSRRIVGHHVTHDLSHYSAVIALYRASEVLGDTRGIIHHSDRGCQYCCHEYLRLLAELGMIPSMTDENHCYQNAVAERVNGILKDELNLDQQFSSFASLQEKVDSAIIVYNKVRTHWSLGLRTPEEIFAVAA